jgi:ClpP class serine protease
VQAKKLKLVDEIGTMEDATQAVAKMAKLKDKPRLVYPAKKSRGLQDLIMGSSADEDDSFEEESSFFDAIVSRVASRIAGQVPSTASVLPAGLYAIWNGAR